MAAGYTLTMAICGVLMGATYAGNPGFVVRITQKGLDYAREQGMTVLRQNLSTIHVPEYSGVYSGFMGKVNYYINSMAITDFQLPSSPVTLLPNEGMRLAISGASIQIRGKWQARYWFISSSGDLDLKALGVSISVGLRLGSDGSGRPTVSTFGCSARISSLQVHFSRGLGWLINLFNGAISSSFKNTMQDQFCIEVNDVIRNHLEPELRSLPVTSKIDLVAAIDYSLTGPPAVTSKNVDVQLKGEFFDRSHRSPPPFSPQPLSLPDDHSLMVYLAASEYLFNTAGFVYQSAGKLIFNVTDDMIPKYFPMRLSMTSFGKMIPQISKMYPARPIKLKISSPFAPSLAVKPGSVTILPILDIQAYAVLPNSNLAPLFLLTLSVNAVADVRVKLNRIVGSLELDSIRIDLKDSNVGPFHVDLLNLAVNYYIAQILLPRVNEILANGYPLPLLDDVELSNVVIKLQERQLQKKVQATRILSITFFWERMSNMDKSGVTNKRSKYPTFPPKMIINNGLEKSSKYIENEMGPTGGMTLY